MPGSIENRLDILLVDDREDGLITLEALLCEYKNYRLVKARSGMEAIRLLDNYDFAVILLDVQMPEMDGFETAEIIRKQPRFQHIPIIFVTAINKDERYVYRGYEAGAVDYIFKPFEPIVLRSKVAIFADIHLKSRQLREQARQLAERDALKHRAYLQSVELESLRRYRSLADAIPHMVLRALPTSAVEYHNELWSKYTGMSPLETVNDGWWNAVLEADHGDLKRLWNAATSSGLRFEIETRLRRHDGVYRWHWIKADAEMDVHGRIIAWLMTCTDIHDRKTTEGELKEARKHAEAANDAKTHFLANMSHEIRTPLNAIMGFTELLLDPMISIEEKMKSVSIVRRNGHQLLKIVDEILDISKVEAGGLVTEKVETNLFNLLNEIKTLMLIQAAKKKIELQVDMSARLPAVVITDSTRLRQILINILGNAIKFTEYGSVNLKPSLTLNSDGRCVLQFDVTDTGLGISPESSEKIFKPFSQADSSTTRLYGGTGLGLALSRKLALALGGDVRLLRSQPGVGSQFVITLEVLLPSAVEWLSDAEDGNEQSEVPSQPPSPDILVGRRVLLVEDAEDNQFLIKQFLNRTGVVVDIASNGEEGVTKALAHEYDVVLMDIQMPLVDGYQATIRLRQAGYKRPIIALTAHALIEEREKSQQAGCDGHLTKPINRTLLIESLLQHMKPKHGSKKATRHREVESKSVH